jgi:hypothetical protein
MQIDTDIFTGVGIDKHTFRAISFPVKKMYLEEYGGNDEEDVDFEKFIPNMYKLLCKDFNFSLKFEYPMSKSDKYKQICKAKVYVNGKYRSDVGYYNNYWQALKQTILAFLHAEWHNLEAWKKSDEFETITDLDQIII